MKTYLLWRLWSLPALLVSYTAVAQGTPPDSSGLATAVSRMREQYTNVIKDQSQLYNGPEYFNYTRYYQTVVGDQFFMSPKEQKGLIEYDGNFYSDIPLLYDLHLDQVIIRQPANGFTIRLINERVKQFSVHGHTFIRITDDSLPQQSVRVGYYDLLLDKGIKLLAKRNKRMQTQPSQNTTRAEFTAKDRFFIERNNTLYPISSKNSIVSLFPNERKVLQKYSQENDLLFNKNTREKDIYQLLRYYTTLVDSNARGTTSSHKEKIK